jgi:hypothetical protein
VIGEGGAKRPHRLDLLGRREDAALELERGESVAVDHSLGLSDDAVGIECLAPVVAVGAWMPGPLVEEVSGERNLLAHGAAEQVGHRPPGRLALNVKARHLEGGEHPVGGRGLADQTGGDGRLLHRDLLHAAVDLLGVVHVRALDGGRRSAQRG